MKHSIFIKSFFVALVLLYFLKSTTAQIYLELAAKGEKNFIEIVSETEKYFDVVGREKGVGYKPFQRWKYQMQRSLDKNGMIVSPQTQMESYQKYMERYPNSKDVSTLYTDLGPTSASNTSTWSSSLGRLSAIGLDINNPNHIIAGSPTGGIWKTIDGGTTWAAIYDYALNINISSLEISHSNPDHYFAGTSSEIIYSTDAGLTWELGLTTGLEVNTIIMDPNDSNVLLATNRFGTQVLRSSDGGMSWSVVYTAPESTYDIEFKPGDSNTVYVSGAGFISKSVDNGISWTTINSGPWDGGVLMMAVSDDNPNHLYALQENNGGYNGTFRSIDNGITWTTQSDNSSGTNNILTYDQTSAGGQAPRDMDIVVSPNNINEVYVAGTELWKSTDGGISFIKVADWLVNSSLPFIHADIDLLYFNDNALYAGTDGGLFVSTDNASTFSDWTSGIGVRQFYRIGASATDPDRVSGGSQDNGTGVLKAGTWYDFMGADGMETFIDWSDEDIIYGNVQFGSLYKSTDGGVTTSYPTQVPGGGNSGFQGSWVTPTEQDPADANTLYQGKFEIYKSTDGATTWTPISVLGKNSFCDEIEVAPSNNQVIYASWESTLYRTNNGGITWSSNIGPGEYINYIDVHPGDPNRVAIAYFGGVKESFDGGTTWNNISSNLPNITYNCVLYENNASDGIFLGGNPGVWHKDNSSSGTWTNTSANLPLVMVSELEIRNNTLYIGTYGRGLWKGELGDKEGYTCATAIDINSIGTYNAPGPNHGNGCNNCTSASHANWYEFTPPFTGDINLYSCLGGTDTRVWIYSGSCGSLTQIGSGDDECQRFYGDNNSWASRVDNIPVTAGVPIYIEWDSRWSQESFFWTIEYESIDCPLNYNLSGVQSISSDYETDGLLESSQTITGTSTMVDYDSASAIDLLPGFEVVIGAVFNAFIDGCGGTSADTEEVESDK